MNRYHLFAFPIIGALMMLFTCDAQNIALSALGNRIGTIAKRNSSVARNIAASIESEEKVVTETNTLICFTLEDAEKVQLVLCDTAGNHRRTLIDRVMFDAGEYKLLVEGVGLAPDRYVYQLRSRSIMLNTVVDVRQSAGEPPRSDRAGAFFLSGGPVANPVMR